MRRLLLLLVAALPAAALDFNDPRAVVAAALESHPTLTRMRAEAAAARERIEPAAALPNPMVMAGVQNKQVDLRDDEMMTMYMVGVSQTLVHPDKRDARRGAAELETQAAEKQVDSARAAIERDVLLAWYELAATDAQLVATAHIREMIDAVVAAARVRYEVGTAMQADVIRAQLQGSDLDHETLRLRGARRAISTRLLSLVGLPVETTIPTVTMPEGTENLAIDAATAPPDDHPALLALEAEVARAEEEIRLMKLELRPDLDLEAQYGHRASQRDVFSVVARIELPLRAKQTVEPRVREAMLRRDAAKNRIDELRRSLTSAMAEAVVAHEEATHQMHFHHQVLVPQAQLAFESTLAAYQTGNAPFDAILTTETDYLRLRLQYFDFLLRHAQAVVSYEALSKGAQP
ncbi:MAG TPA: TolC family protein [Thermoanaerobaculia bacterium]|jgi:outer membrane protein TolC|nr:TolC family protein [Thermoanaerobaculia bacterium]